MHARLFGPMLRSLCACVLVGVVFPCCAASAEDSLTLRTDLPPALAQRLVQEAQAREACKKVICEAARSKKADGDPITCSVLKTWPAQDLRDKILRGKLEWKLGHAQCKADISLDRSAVAKVLSEPKFEMKVGKHRVSCNLEQEDGKDTHELTFTIDPVVTFENGKAIKAALNWGEVNGSTLAKTALWSATAVDNTFNVLQGVVLEQINDFFGRKCDAALK